jgi:hypothetical protein
VYCVSIGKPGRVAMSTYQLVRLAGMELYDVYISNSEVKACDVYKSNLVAANRDSAVSALRH